MKRDEPTKETFDLLITKIPFALREIARGKVSKRAEQIALENDRDQVTEKEMVEAFFHETPGGFWGPLQVDMEEIGLDYTKHGIERV